MPRESLDERKKRAASIAREMEKHYADTTALRYHDLWELLVATILSAQCTDKRVNEVTPVLFRRYPDAGAMAKAPASDLEKVIRSTGFFRAKARAIRETSAAVVERFGGKVPTTMEGMLTLPGVGRKTANVVLGNGLGLAVGVVVDTHVKRLAYRMGLTRDTDPERIEQDLMKLLPRDRWIAFSNHLIRHGREICVSRKPKCGVCPVNPLCPRVGV